MEGRFERINQHPVMFYPFMNYIPKDAYYSFYLSLIWMQNAGSHSFSIGVTEVLNTNLLLELSADDIEYVYQRLISFPNINNCYKWLVIEVCFKY